MEDERYFHEEPAVSFNIGRGLNMFIFEHLHSYIEWKLMDSVSCRHGITDLWIYM